ncbi:ASCH domain-containing protein [Paenibacillus polysaccharolyticus]|uniref:ASCH domain-containing protein n=1 Tax=Paenibacillus polysaccharolyticus TaxID=582692 RepID=UPI00209FED60|nr:ASCH domain-containing protein [Paenibacillus polysaccharolyticus]MCP1133406.1 ASCH domain-containing protein [Paenibacillus polysaccharolyticus]
MKVLSMIQPWATLLVQGETLYETRSWKTRYRGLLAIHASQKVDKQACKSELIRSLLAKNGYTEQSLPTGVILATCELTNCYQVIDANHTSAILDCGKVVTGEDFLLGDYSPGYFAWEIAGFRLLKHYIPTKGKLGLWEHPIDEELMI